MTENTNDLYSTAMRNIGRRMALQQIRKVIKDSELPDHEKLNLVCQIVHSYENDIKKGE